MQIQGITFNHGSSKIRLYRRVHLRAIERVREDERRRRLKAAKNAARRNESAYRRLGDAIAVIKEET